MCLSAEGRLTTANRRNVYVYIWSIIKHKNISDIVSFYCSGAASDKEQSLSEEQERRAVAESQVQMLEQRLSG